MPRKNRVDYPSAINHVMVRGVAGMPIFADDQDRYVFLSRANELFDGVRARTVVWSLMPNHAHQQTQTLASPLSKVMHRQDTAYAQYFNKRHDRKGHVFQNRYKSLLVADEDYLFRLIRYVLLNPIRASIVADLDELGDYRWTSYPALMGRTRPLAFDLEFTLNLFGQNPVEARARLRDWLQAGVDEDDEIGLLVTRPPGRPRKEDRSAVLTSRIAARNSFVSGNPTFVADVLARAGTASARSTRLGNEGWAVDSVLLAACVATGADPRDVRQGRRLAEASAARAITAWISHNYLRETFTAMSDCLGVTPNALARASLRGRDLALKDCPSLLAILEKG